MVEVYPFKGLHYNPDGIGDIAAVLAPPYDIISEKQKKTLMKKSPYSIVNLTLPEKSADKTRYEKAEEILEKWIDNRVFISDKDRSFYLFEEAHVLKIGVKKYPGIKSVVFIYG